MESKKFLKDISASTIQVAVTQVANLLIFYLISKYISKEEFGFYNWSMAVVTTVITILSLGMDVIYVRRVSTDFKSILSSKIHFYHTTVLGGVLILLILLFRQFFNFSPSEEIIFILALVCQVTFSIANSFRLFLNGRENFNYLAYSAIITNSVRVILILGLLIFNAFSIYYILTCFVICYLLELSINSFYKRKSLKESTPSNKTTNFQWKEYFFFIKESVPQLGVIIFDSSIARIDWILMGIIATTVATAEYSFAFKVFELSKLPYIIIAPILLSRFSKLLKKNLSPLTEKQKTNLQNLLNLEVIISLMIPFVLICIWSDFFDWVTDNKYGKVNEITYMILSIAIPIHCINNFLWSIGVAQNQLKIILYNIVAVSILNLVLNIILIPLYSSLGAAISYMIPSIVQLFIYYKTIDLTKVKIKINTALLIILIGVALILIVQTSNLQPLSKVVIVIGSFVLILFSTKIISLAKVKSALDAL